MDIQFSEDLLVKLYCEVDDLYHAYWSYVEDRGGKRPSPNRSPQLNPSEICTILVACHLSGYKCFEYYYGQVIKGSHGHWFPDAPSYERFLAHVGRAVDMLHLWAVYNASKAGRTGMYFIDSKKLQVCHIKREHSHKVFQGWASKGKSSTGWFFGLKIHLVINNLGEPVTFLLTPGNVADNNKAVLAYLLGGLKGTCTGDKGYMTTLFADFYENGLEILKKPKKKMRGLPVENFKNKLINMRPVIESAFDIMASVCNIEHSRHRNPINGLSHILSALIAYQYMPKKPSVLFPSINENCREKLLNMAA
jgi:hypothetical protein